MKKNIDFKKLIYGLLLKENDINEILNNSDEAWICYEEGKKIISVCIKIKNKSK